MKLQPNEVGALESAIEDIIQRRERAKQRLIPRHEAQAIQDTLNEIKALADEIYEVNKRGAEPLGSLRSRLDSITRLCDERILEMHSHFNKGRKRPIPGK